MKRRGIDDPSYRIHRAPVRKIPRSTALLRTAAVSLTLVVLIFGWLTLQMASGRDPVLGANVGTSDAGAGTGSSDASSVDASAAFIPSVAQAPIVQQVAPAPTPVQTSTS